MTDFLERSLRRLGGQVAGHVSMAGDDGYVKPTAIWAKTATRELRAMMQGPVAENRAVTRRPIVVATSVAAE